MFFAVKFTLFLLTFNCVDLTFNIGLELKRMRENKKNQSIGFTQLERNMNPSITPRQVERFYMLENVWNFILLCISRTIKYNVHFS